MFILLLLLLLLLVGAQCPERAGGREPVSRVRCPFLVPSWCPEPPSPSSPPPPLPNPALPLVPGSLRRTHHDGRRRAAPDSVSTRDEGVPGAARPGHRGSLWEGAAGERGRSRDSRRHPGRGGAGAKCIPHLSPFPWEGSPPFPHQSLPGAWGLFRSLSVAPSFAPLSQAGLGSVEAVGPGERPLCLCLRVLG